MLNDIQASLVDWQVCVNSVHNPSADFVKKIIYVVAANYSHYGKC